MSWDDGLETEKNNNTFIKPVSLFKLVQRDEHIQSNFCQISFLIKRSESALASSQILSNLSPPSSLVKNTSQAQHTRSHCSSSNLLNCLQGFNGPFSNFWQSSQYGSLSSPVFFFDLCLEPSRIFLTTTLLMRVP